MMNDEIRSMPDKWCYVCNKYESIPESGAYKVCFECNHVYITEDDLLVAHNNMLSEMDEERIEDLGDLQYCCGMCSHDF